MKHQLDIILRVRLSCAYIAIFFLSLFSTVHAASIFLRAVDTEGKELQQVGVGQPFVLEVKISDINHGIRAPTIAGIERFNGRRTSVRMNSINGKSTMCYSYIVRVDKPGTVQVGPAVIVYKGIQVTSNVLKISASDNPVLREKKAKKGRTHQQAFMRFSVDNEQVVVGQKVHCALRFYYSDDSITLKKINTPEYNGFTKSDITGPYTGSHVVNGKRYVYAEWRWQLYPQESAKKMLATCSADFHIPMARDSFFSGLSSFFHAPVKRKRVYSNVVHLDVDPLPPYHEPVQAIGSFEHIQARIKPSVAKEGTGMVLTIEVAGNGNIEMLNNFVLQGMPDGLRCYDSKKYIVDPIKQGDTPKKHFEFIVQGLKTGDWEIPSQKLTYFDIDKKKYKTLYTAPIITTITPGSRQVRGLNDNNAKDNRHNGVTEEKDELSPINNNGPWYPVRERNPMPFQLFLFFVILPFFSGAYYFVIHFFNRYNNKNNVQKRFKRAFTHARTQLKKAVRTRNVTLLHGLFIELIAHRCMMPENALSAQRIEHLLMNKGVSDDVIITWNYFFTQLAEHSFGKKYRAHESEDTIFKQAEQWVRHLEKIL